MTANKPRKKAKRNRSQLTPRQLRLLDVEWMLEEGWNARQISNRMRIPATVIEQDVELLQKQQKLKELHKQKLDGGQIAAQLGVSRQRVWQMRKNLGLSTARPPTTRKRRLPIVAALVEQGLRAPEIADQLGVRRTLICNDVKALGLKTKTPTEQREGAIRQLLEQGKGQDAIGHALKLSPFTIRNDCRKLGLLALLDATNR